MHRKRLVVFDSLQVDFIHILRGYSTGIANVSLKQLWRIWMNRSHKYSEK